MQIRFDKLLALNGIGSRKEIRKLLRTQCYTVNGTRITNPAVPIIPETDTVCCNGAVLTLRMHCYIMLHKPAGVVTSTQDPIHRTVIDLLPEPFSRMQLFPIGRLDIDTEGLLIITNDGELTHRITAPKSHCVKIYYIETVQPFTHSEFVRWQELCATGLQLANGLHCLPAQLEITQCPTEVSAANNSGEYRSLFIHIYEGKYHQVKKMLKALGNEVRYLKRVAMGKLFLDGQLPCGSCRELTTEEIMLLKNSCG
ncbi:MAG: pseudouridine synthase [Treponema sp.]